MASSTELLDQLLALSIMIDKDLTATLGKDGLTLARTHLLWELHRSGPVTQQRLAAVLEVSPRNVTALVDGLVASGHVTRDRHPEDRRAFLITLTEHGSAAMAAMAVQHEEFAEALFGPISARDRAATARALDHARTRLAALMEEHHGEGS